MYKQIAIPGKMANKKINISIEKIQKWSLIAKSQSKVGKKIGFHWFKLAPQWLQKLRPIHQNMKQKKKNF